MMMPVLTKEEYMAIRNGGEQRERVKRIRQGEEGLKHKLVQMNYSCLPNEDGTLKGSTRMSTTVGMDIDWPPSPLPPREEEQIAAKKEEWLKKVPELVLAKKDELGLLMLEESATKGYHLVFRRRPELSQEENLKWASELLGVDFDENAKDITRVFFTTSSKELLFLDEEIFSPLPALPTVAKLPNRSDSAIAPLGECQKGECNIVKCLEESNTPPKGEMEGASFKGIPYSQIIAEYWRLTGGEPSEGERNVKLHKLAVNLRAICDNNEEWLLEVMPRYGLPEQEMRSIIHSACKEPTKGSKLIDQIVKSAESSSPSGEVGSGVPPVMPAKLPKLVQLLTSKTPDVYKAAVAHAIFPPLATHLCDVRFTYTDNVDHEATLMNCLMAGTGAGKGCIDKPIDRIMADIKRRDKENERREAEWKKDCQKKGANKDKQVRPEGLVIQMIDPDMTKPALVTRMDEAEGHFVYVKLNELDLFDQLKGSTGRQHFQLMCLAFDPDSEYGQTRIGTQSVTARPMCRFNWNACTTIMKGRRYFRNVLTDGPVSRINFCTIPEREIGAPQPKYGQYDAAFEEALKPYIDNLVAARGLIDCPQAFKLSLKLQEECADFARLSQSRTYENLSFRANVIAWLKACVLYVANGRKWEKSIEEFVRWSLNYDLWCKMQFFGADIERANRGDDARIGTRGPRNLLELLPDVFTIDDAKSVRQQQGMDTERTGNMISNWKKRRYVVQMSDVSFQKSERFLRSKA